MAGLIPQDFIDNLLGRLDVVDVVGSRLTLKRSGDNFLARCPFHEEKTPSFSVSRSKQFYHCFGCGAHGSAISFLMDYDQLDFPEAIEILAASIGLDVPREQGDERQAESNRDLFAQLEDCGQLYRRTLRDYPAAVAYLKERGLSGEIARDFALGYAPEGWDTLRGAFGERAQANLFRAGMLIQNKQGGYYDRFRDRIMFPIRDTRGRTIGFGGRALGETTPKYLNSPESPVFHKRREVYGLYEARQAGVRDRPILLVEGYMDVIALHQHGLPNSVATLGTAVTADQLKRLFRETYELIFCFDGDAAGQRAAWRALEMALPLLDDGREVRFALLAQGDDPDDLIRREGTDAFQRRIAESPPAAEFMLATLKEQTATDTIGGRARLAELARPLINKLPPGLYAELLTDRLAQEIGGHRANVRSALQQHNDSSNRADKTIRAQHGRPPQRMTPLRLVIALLLNDPRLEPRLLLPDELMQSAEPGMDLLRSLLQYIRSIETPTAGLLMHRLEAHEQLPVLVKLASWEPPVSLDEAQRQALFDDAVHSLQRDLYRRHSESLLALAGQRDLTDTEKQQLNELIKKSK
ncbi:MAG: DNA primase [Gammaproteobacteria bacterium]|nr:DNA primase [Gammaproteobacteria bacterium]